ncbi:MAG: hypothetical protein LBD27_07650, partial [Tannerella sp.]|nr:hypothetical protein [Tannerella sp.]
MKCISFPSAVLLLLTGAMLLPSCKKNKDIVPSSEYAPYVSAYTGGVIRSDASIQIELAREQPVVEIGAEAGDRLFIFSPSLKGYARWINSKTIEFIPNPGELKPGTLYNAAFALAKVVEVDKKLATFDFSFRVEEDNFDLRAGTPEVSAGATDKVTVTGEIVFSNPSSLSTVEQM